MQRLTVSDMPDMKKPQWLKVRYNAAETREVAQLMSSLGLNTVCTSASCPNLGTCYRHKTATFMILGAKCTRNCAFCDVPHAKAGELLPPDPDEPRRIAMAAQKLGLRHIVVTCVTRDDLPDGGAGVFAEVIREVRKSCPQITTEVLISDFKGDKKALGTVMAEKPDVLNHNIETVPSLYSAVRPGAVYSRSLEVLRAAKEYGTSYTKTGIMLGLGETDDELREVFENLREIKCDILVISQYLQPSSDHYPLQRYVTPEEFENYKKIALDCGIKYVVSAPLVRSSYLAAEALEGVREK